MLDNMDYDLMEEITQVSKSLSRYKMYEEDARRGGCEGCVNLWERLRERNEQDLRDLTSHLKEHVDSGRFDKQTWRAA